MSDSNSSPLAWFMQKERLPRTIIGMAIVLVIFMVITRPQGVPQDQQEQSFAVESLIAEPQCYESTVQLYGVIESPYTSQLAASISANVDTVPAREGDLVARGQLLVQLDPQEAELALTRATADVNEISAQITSQESRFATDMRALDEEQAQLDLLNKDLERLQSLAERQLTSESSVDEIRRNVAVQTVVVNERQLSVDDHVSRLAQLESNLQRAQASEAQAQLDLARTQINSPFMGRVANVHVSPQERVSPGTQLIDVYDLETIEVRAQIPLRYLTLVQQLLDANQAVSAEAQLNGQTLNLHLDRLAGVVSAGRGGVDALFELTNDHDSVVLGRTIELQLRLPQPDPAIAVPISALYRNDRVYVIEDDRLRSVLVAQQGEMLDEQGNTQILVYSDELQAGDKILTTLLSNAMTGLKVYDAPDAHPQEP